MQSEGDVKRDWAVLVDKHALVHLRYRYTCADSHVRRILCWDHVPVSGIPMRASYLLLSNGSRRPAPEPLSRIMCVNDRNPWNNKTWINGFALILLGHTWFFVGFSLAISYFHMVSHH